MAGPKIENTPRVVLLTSNENRHRYAASRLAAGTDLVGVVAEVKASNITSASPLQAEEQKIVDRHFAERDHAEQKLLGMNKFPNTDRIEIRNGAVNDPEILEWIEKREPDAVVLYGTSLIKGPLLDAYSGRMVNLHLGLSPYYRGAGTNFWPLVYGEPECVGATLHLAVAKVDAGPVLGQVRPSAEHDDRSHELGTKALMAAVEILPEALSLCVMGKIVYGEQDLSMGRVFRRKDFNTDAVLQMWRNLDSGMIADYLAEAGERCNRKPIHTLKTAKPVGSAA
jgi:folate-dependent phosphoribosylglycinamide formyltransferase PurN